MLVFLLYFASLGNSIQLQFSVVLCILNASVKFIFVFLYVGSVMLQLCLSFVLFCTIRQQYSELFSVVYIYNNLSVKFVPSCGLGYASIMPQLCSSFCYYFASLGNSSFLLSIYILYQ